jgi:hypothetical protein
MKNAFGLTLPIVVLVSHSKTLFRKKKTYVEHSCMYFSHLALWSTMGSANVE